MVSESYGARKAPSGCLKAVFWAFHKYVLSMFWKLWALDIAPTLDVRSRLAELCENYYPMIPHSLEASKNVFSWLKPFCGEIAQKKVTQCQNTQRGDRLDSWNVFSENKTWRNWRALYLSMKLRTKLNELNNKVHHSVWKLIKKLASVRVGLFLLQNEPTKWERRNENSRISVWVVHYFK